MFVLANLIYTLSVIVISYCIYLYMKNRRFWKLINKFNGDKTLPIVGNALAFRGTSVDVLNTFFQMWERNNKETFKIQIVNQAYVLLCEPEIVEIILSSNKELKKTDDYRFLKSWLGDGLIITHGNKWRALRKIITPAFHFKILEQFIDVYNKNGDILIKKLAEKKGMIFDVYPLATLCALDIICEAAMGQSVNAQENSESEYVKSVQRMTEIFPSRIFSVWKRFDCLYRFSTEYQDEKKAIKVLHGKTNEVMQNRKKHLKNEILNNKPSHQKYAFLDLLLLSKTPDGEPLTDLTIRQEIDTFMLAGHETTSSCISYAMYCLANNPEIQNLAFEEQLNLLGKDLNKNPTNADLQNMKYLERVIKETLRLFPVAPAFGRTIIDDVTLPDGRIIPSGALAIVNLPMIGKNPKYFPDPLKFDPDRFLFENTKNNHPFLSIPFSAGPRNCIGQRFAMNEMKTLLSKILRNYKLISGGQGTELRLAVEIVLKSKTGVKIQLRDRLYK